MNYLTESAINRYRRCLFAIASRLSEHGESIVSVFRSGEIDRDQLKVNKTEFNRFIHTADLLFAPDG